MPVAKPPRARNAVATACDWVKQAVIDVAELIAAIATVSAASPSRVVSHSPTNMPVVELTVAGTGTPITPGVGTFIVHNVPAAVAIGAVSVAAPPAPGSVTRP